MKSMDLGTVGGVVARRSGHRNRVRLVLTVVGLLGMLAGTAPSVDAQTEPKRAARWEFLVPSGKIVPTGDQRSAIRRGNITAAQLSFLVRPALALTGTVGWARSRDVASEDEPRLDVFTYDLGVEARLPRKAETAITLSPFIGAGVGARSYNYRSLEMDATHNLAGYGSVGGELAKGRFRLRIEARDYLTGFKPLDGAEGSDTRNDVVVMAGLRILAR